MFVVWLALPLLCWRTALALRVSVDEVVGTLEVDEQVLEKHIHHEVQLHPVATGPLALSQLHGKMNRSASIHDAIHKSFTRGCMVELANEREVFMRQKGVEWQASTNISTALEALFEAEDLAQDAQPARDLVHQLGLSLREVENLCESTFGQPMAGVVKECVKDFAERNRTRARSWFIMRGWGEKDVKHPNAALPEWLEERFEIDHALELIGLSSEDFFEAAPAARVVKTAHEGMLSDNKDQIKATGFSVTHTRHHCQEVYKEETAHRDEVYLERVALEMLRAEIVDGVCQQLEESTCPESTSPRHMRQVQYRRALQVYTVGYLLSAPAIILTGGILGAMAGSIWSGVTYSLVFTATPGFTNLVPLPFAALAAVPIFGECACNLNPCEWDAENRLCAMTPSEASSNEFQWVPYPGTKCVPAVDFDEANPACRMDVCSREDVQNKRPGLPGHVELFGKIGVDTDIEGRAARGVYNCLSQNGDASRTGDLALKATWVDFEGDEVPNTPENRIRLYSHLNLASSR